MMHLSARLGVALVLVLVAGGSTMGMAQAPGRWRIVLSPTLDVRVRGELRLEQRDGLLGGTLLLETSDSAPEAVTGRLLENGWLEFGLADRTDHRFEGRIVADQMYGTAYLRTGAGEIAWVADRIEPEADFFVPLPRFTMRQLALSRGTGSVELDGRWFSVMAARGLDTDDALARYRDLAARAGVSAANEGELRSHGYLQSMGLWRRDELLRASAAALEQVRNGLPDDSTRARFDFVFRPGGEWLNDIHDVAIQRTQTKFPHVTWDAVAPALRVPGVSPFPIPAGTAAAPWMAYRLFVLSRRDPDRFRTLLGDMRALEPDATGSLERLLIGYAEAVRWYPRAMALLLEGRWLEGRSPADLVRARWPAPTAGLPIPAIVPRLYGHPDGAPRVKPSDRLVGLLISTDNWTATQWQRRHGTEGLLTVIGRLPPEIDSTTIEGPAGPFRLTSIPQLRERPVGFLDAADAVVLSPSYMPALALETVLHEWIHILHQRARSLENIALVDGDRVTLRPPDSFVAEGLAEWLAAELFHPVREAVPFMGLGELEKRATMALTRPDDPHLVGYYIFRSLELQGAEPDSIILAAIDQATDPNGLLPLLGESETAANAVSRTFVMPHTRYVIPEVTFEIDGRTPIIRSRRVLPPGTGQ